MRQKSIAVLLALALVLSLCAVTAFAGETAEDQQAAAGGSQSEETAAETEEEAPEEEAPSLAGPDAEPETDPETGEAIESALIEPDAVGTVSYANVERRMR